MHSVQQALEKTGLWREFSYYGLENDKRQNIDFLESLLQASTTCKVKTYNLVARGTEKQLGRLVLNLHARVLTLRIVYDTPVLSDYWGDLLSHLIDAVCHIRDALGTWTLMGSWVNVEIVGAVYSRICPSHFHLRFVF